MARSVGRPVLTRLSSVCGRRRVDLGAGLLLAGCALMLFRLSLFDGWTFVGDSDRLNNIMNLRLFEVVSLLERGAIPAWNEHELMGYAVSGVHWMLPGSPPLPHLLAALPLSAFYHALAILAAVLFAATMLAAYWALGPYGAGPVQRIVGALLYATGAYTVHKLMQLDLSYAALVAPPILHRLVYVTTRERAPWTFLGMTACWAFLVVFTVLQEVAYIGLFWGLYALYRSVRLRTPWPVLAAGLAFLAGVAIGTPRVVTIATEASVVSRTSENLMIRPVEALRYFGDGLLGRTHDEQGLLRIPPVNLHEGVQLLGSPLAALAAIALGALTRSSWLRSWSVALLLVLSVALCAYFPSFYGLGLQDVTYPSPQVRALLINALLLGLPTWLLWRRLSRSVAATASEDRDGRERGPGKSSAIADDLPFLYGFVVLALAIILIPEARLLLYYSFMKLDFMHSRISVAMTLPLAIIAVAFLNRFLPAESGSTKVRWRAVGLALGPILWIGREPVVTAIVAQVGSAVEALRPWPILTPETVRVLTSLLMLLVAATLLVRQTRTTRLAVAGGVMASWMALETVGLADHRMNGPVATMQEQPYASFDYLQVPGGSLRVPSMAARTTVLERLESDRYRSVLLEDHSKVPPRADSHLAALWGLRLVEGYSTGSPRRYEALPWSSDVATPHYTDLHGMHSIRGIPWTLLGALNVKYAVTVDRSFWFNPSPGGPVPPFDLSRLQVIENPKPVTPRVFFAARVSPARASPRLAGDQGRRPSPRDPPIEQPTRHSVAEGFPDQRRFPTDGTIDATFDGDRVRVLVDPLSEDRFLILNEMYHPSWRATVDGAPVTIYPTNLVMRGILIPAGATTVELAFQPFVFSPAGYAIMAGGVLLTMLLAWGLRQVDFVPYAPFLTRRGTPLLAGQRAPGTT